MLVTNAISFNFKNTTKLPMSLAKEDESILLFEKSIRFLEVHYDWKQRTLKIILQSARIPYEPRI